MIASVRRAAGSGKPNRDRSGPVSSVAKADQIGEQGVVAIVYCAATTAQCSEPRDRGLGVVRSAEHSHCDGSEAKLHSKRVDRLGHGRASVEQQEGRGSESEL